MLIGALAKTPGTLLHRKLAGDDWTLDQHLLALAVDAMRIANWQRSKDGSKASKRPKPISPLAQQKKPMQRGDTGGQSRAAVVAILRGYRTGAYEAGG